MPGTSNMRSEWFEHVRKTRKKMSKGKKVLVPHRDAMSAASQTWPTVKIKVQKRLEREQKKAQKLRKCEDEKKAE